ncbi:unnamed protein product [Prunus brigantina]
MWKYMVVICSHLSSLLNILLYHSFFGHSHDHCFGFPSEQTIEPSSLSTVHYKPEPSGTSDESPAECAVCLCKIEEGDEELGQYYPDVQSVHGLICGSSSFRPEFFILNPSTREYIELPHAKERPVNRYARHAYHFGFSPLTDEYKVLQVLSFRLDQGDKWDLVFNTFTLGRDSWWRPLQVDHGDLPFDALAYASDSYEQRSTASVCLNGAVYWIYEKQKMLVAFDVKEETFKALPLPEDYDQVFANYYADQDYEEYSRIDANDYCCPTMVKVGGCVGVFADMSWKHDKIVLWILKDYKNIVWVKETISLASEREYLGYHRYIELWVQSTQESLPSCTIFLDFHQDMTMVHPNCVFMI